MKLHWFLYSPDDDTDTGTVTDTATDTTTDTDTDTSTDKSTDTDSSKDTGSAPSPVNIHYDVTLVAQPDDFTCWAASSSMILSYWRDTDNQSSSPYYTTDELKDMVNNANPDLDVSKGLKPEDTQPVGDILGLAFDFPMCYGVDGFARTLQNKGPIVF